MIFWLKRQSCKYFYLFCHNVQRNLPLICNVCILPLCIYHDRGLTESIQSHIIGVMFDVTFFLLRFCHNFTYCSSKLLIRQWFIMTIIVVNESFQDILKLFIFCGGHACLFIRHVKSVQNISSTFEYFKIPCHFICNWIFLILCVFFLIYTFVNALLFVSLYRTFADDDVFWFALVRIIDLR